MVRHACSPRSPRPAPAFSMPAAAPDGWPCAWPSWATTAWAPTVDPSMLEVARQRGPQLPWYESDLARLDLGSERPFDLVVAAGNVMPLLAAGTGPSVVSNLAAVLVRGGLLVAGFGLDAAHLPIPEPTVDLAEYDEWCAAAGLVLDQRLFDLGRRSFHPYDGNGYAVSVHRVRVRLDYRALA